MDEKPNILRRIIQSIRKRKRLSIAIIIFLIIAAVVGRVFYNRSRPSELEIYEAQKMDITKSIEVSGEVEADESVDLHFQTLGRLSWIGVKEGERVDKWQAVASLDKRTLEKQLKQDLIAFEKQYRDFEQSVDDNPLVNHRFKRILEKAQFDLNSEVLDVEIKNLAIELATLVSPIAGIVTNVDTPVAGVNVVTTNSITIVNPNTVFFEVEVDESDIALLEINQKAILTLDSYEDEEIETQVYHIDFQSSLSDGGGTVFLVRLTLPENEREKFKLGMTGDAKIVLEEKQNMLVVPVESLIERNGKSFVDVIDSSGEVERKEIDIGLESEDYVEIISGINESEEVVIPQ